MDLQRRKVLLREILRSLSQIQSSATSFFVFCHPKNSNLTKPKRAILKLKGMQMGTPVQSPKVFHRSPQGWGVGQGRRFWRGRRWVKGAWGGQEEKGSRTQLPDAVSCPEATGGHLPPHTHPITRDVAFRTHHNSSLPGGGNFAEMQESPIAEEVGIFLGLSCTYFRW